MAAFLCQVGQDLFSQSAPREMGNSLSEKEIFSGQKGQHVLDQLPLGRIGRWAGETDALGIQPEYERLLTRLCRDAKR